MATKSGGYVAPKAPGTVQAYALTQAQKDAEIKRKASLGIAVSDSANQAALDAARANATKEIYRKADAGIALTGNSPLNQSLYDARLAANKPVEAEVTASAVSTPTSQGTPQSFIDGLNNARRNQTLADLGKSRDNALSNLSGEKSAIAPKYYDQRNQVAAGAQQQARNFAEYMAARGGTSSGANAQAELSQNMTTQGNLGSLGRQEAADFSDIERRTTGVRNAYESDVASANAGIESDRMKAMLDDYYQQQQRELQIAGLTGAFQGQKTLAGQQFDLGKLTDQRNFDYQSGRDTVGDSQWQQQMDLSKTLSDRDFNYQVGRDDVSDSQWAQGFAESVKQNGIQNALAQVKASSSGSGGSGGGTKDLSLAQKISIWKISGEAPEGIPGVKPGTKVYDEVAARKAAEESGGVNLWGAIKGVINKLSSGSSGVSDEDISEFTK